MNDLYNSRLKTYAKWNGSAWCDEETSGAYFYTIEKANNNGYFQLLNRIDTQKTIIRFYENSYQFYVVEVSMEGTYVDLFNGIANKFNKQHTYRGKFTEGLWADIICKLDIDQHAVYRVIEIKQNLLKIIQLVKDNTLEVVETPSKFYSFDDNYNKWVHLVTNPKELNVLATL